MTRKKVKLAYISNDSARKATFKKRKKGLMKKVSELSTLCGIDTCAIIFSPYDSQPEIWPSSPLGVQRVLSQFKKMPEMEQSKKMVNQDAFLRQRIGKANEQLKKLRKDCREKEMTQVMFQCLTGKSLLSLSIMDLNDMGWLIDQNLKDICKRIETLKKIAPPPPSSSNNNWDNSWQQVVEKPSGVIDQMNMDAIMQTKQQWFIDLINPQLHFGFAGDEILYPFGESSSSHTTLWSNSFYP